MTTKNFLQHLFLGALMLTTWKVMGQSTTPGNVAGANTDFLGWDNTFPANNFPLRVRHDLNQPIEWWTDAIQRLRLYPTGIGTINGFQVPNSGFLGLSGRPGFFTGTPGPFSRMHLVDSIGTNTVNIYAQSASFRPWQRNGVTFTGNADHGYVGQKYNAMDQTDMVVHWGNDPGPNQFAPDYLRFIFTGGYDSTVTTGARSWEGLESMRLSPVNDSSAFVGVGDFWRATVLSSAVVNPSERLDVLDRTIRIQRLLPDYQNDTLENIVVSDSTGRLHWRPLSSIQVSDCDWIIENEGVSGGAVSHNVYTAVNASDDCPDADDAVGIGVDLASSAAQAKLGVLSTAHAIGVDVDEQLSGSSTTGVRVRSTGGTALNEGIYVKAQQGSGEAAENYGVYIDALGAGENSSDWNYGLHAELSGGSYRTRGVSAHTTGARFTAIAGWFIADDEAVYTRGALGYARGGELRYGVEGRADAGTVNGQNWGPASSAIGVRRFADAGDDCPLAIGVYGEATGATDTSANWAGYFRGDVQITGDLWHGATMIFSDENLKTDIEDVTGALGQVLQLQPKTYEYNSSAYPMLNLSEAPQIGLLAQDVQQVVPEAVASTVVPAQYDSLGNETTAAFPVMGIDYVKLIPLLIGAFQEQQTTIAGMQQQLAACCAAPTDSDQRNGSIGTETEEEKLTPAQERLLRIAPNPFTDRTTLYCNLERGGRMQLIANSADGRDLIMLAEGQREAGEFQHLWSTEQLAPGVYYVTLLLDGEPVVKRAVKVGR